MTSDESDDLTPTQEKEFLFLSRLYPAQGGKTVEGMGRYFASYSLGREASLSMEEIDSIVSSLQGQEYVNVLGWNPDTGHAVALTAKGATAFEKVARRIMAEDQNSPLIEGFRTGRTE